MSAQGEGSARMLPAVFGIVAIGFATALVTDLALTELSTAKTAFLLGGFALLIPTFILKDPKAYWLFLLVLSIPFDISKWFSDQGLTQEIVDKYGMPGSGTVSLEIFVTDVVLAAMLIPWLIGLCLTHQKVYFPRIGYLFIFYLGWSLLVSLINAESVYLSMFELCRQALYLLLFVYLINNITTAVQLRSVIWAVVIGLILSAGSVIVFFERGIGTDTVAFAGLHDQPAQAETHKSGGKGSAPQTLTLNGEGRRLGLDREEGSAIKRSQGMFGHPAIPASLSGLILPIILAYFMVARSHYERIFLSFVYVWGVAGLVLTFSRAGLIGFLAGSLAFFVVGGWSGLIPRRMLRLSMVFAVVAMAIAIPLLIVYMKTRPDSFVMRFHIFDAALRGYAQHPFLGVGLNNGTVSMKAGKMVLKEMGVQIPAEEAADSFYLTALSEIGPVGFLLFFGFFFRIIMIALRSTREVAADLKPLLVGMIAGFAALATQSLADQPSAGHAVSGTLWLFAALIVVIARRTQVETRSLPALRHPAPVVVDLLAPR